MLCVKECRGGKCRSGLGGKGRTEVQQAAKCLQYAEHFERCVLCFVF
jgi:hypothetical protein